MDADQLIYVFLSSFGEKTPIAFGQQNVSLKTSVTFKVTGTEAI